MPNLLTFYLMPICLIFLYNLKIIFNIILILINPFQIWTHLISKYILNEWPKIMTIEVSSKVIEFFII
jgi:hypothetical protein